MKLSIEQLYEVAKDRPLSSSEIHLPNDFYGNATILKEYAQFPPEYQIKAVIEHGLSLGDSAWDADVNAPLPGIFCWGEHRYPVFRRRTGKALFAIGPIMSYASHYLDEETLNSEKRRLGRSLLAAPEHSSHWIQPHFDIDEYCRVLEDLGKQFDTVRICLGWKDILLGLAEEFTRHGFECVTAGHMYDPLFVPRLKSIIELATTTTTFKAGTFVGLSVLMGKPLFMTKTDYKYLAESDEILKRDLCPRSEEFHKSANEISAAFSEPRSDISEEQFEIVDRYWGISQHKDISEMQSLLQVTEDMYSSGRIFYMSNTNVQVEHALDYLNNGRSQEALGLFEQARKVYPDLYGIDLGRAVALARIGKKAEAVRILKELLRNDPENQKGRLLLNEVTKANGSRLLNLGCGQHYHPDWTNVDFHSTNSNIRAHDLSQGVPCEDNSFDVVYHSHLLEHFSRSYALLFLKECFRVLNAGGVIRVVVPDLEQIVRWYLTLLGQAQGGERDAQDRYDWILLELFDQMVRNTSGGAMFKYWQQNPMPAESFVIDRVGSEVLNVLKNIRNSASGHKTGAKVGDLQEPLVLDPQQIGQFRLSGEIHQWMYDRYSLGKLLQQAGFTEVRGCRANESQISNFNAYLLDIEPDGSIRKPDSLFMEGQKDLPEAS